MIISKLILKTILFLFILYSSSHSEVKFEASKIDLKENGNIIEATDSRTILSLKKISISSYKAIYNKEKKFIEFSSNVFFSDKKNNVEIKSDDIKYNIKEDIIYSEHNTEIIIKNKYKIKSKEIYYDRLNNKLYSEKETEIVDNENNIYKLKNNFEFDLTSDKLLSKKAEIIDSDNNKYFFENLFIDLKNNKIAGKELKIEFVDSFFGNKNNDPVLRGRSAYSNDNELKVFKTVLVPVILKKINVGAGN